MESGLFKNFLCPWHMHGGGYQKNCAFLGRMGGKKFTDSGCLLTGIVSLPGDPDGLRWDAHGSRMTGQDFPFQGRAPFPWRRSAGKDEQGRLSARNNSIPPKNRSASCHSLIFSGPGATVRPVLRTTIASEILAFCADSRSRPASMKVTKLLPVQGIASRINRPQATQTKRQERRRTENASKRTVPPVGRINSGNILLTTIISFPAIIRSCSFQQFYIWS